MLRYLRLVFLAMHVVCVSLVRGEESVRILLIQMPVNEGIIVRPDLNDSTKGLRMETMDAVLKRKGAIKIAFNQTNPWLGDPVSLSKAMYRIEFDGAVAKELGVNLRLEGIMIDPGIEEMLTSEIALPTNGKGNREFQNLDNRVIVKPGRSQERACWGDATESLMLWQFSTVEGHEPSAKSLPGKSKTFMRVEMYWFQASANDIATLAQSKPETRNKAFQWLSGRARLWKECGFQVRQDDQAVWSAADGKLELRGKEAVAEEERFAIIGGFSVAGDFVKMDWEVADTRKGNELNRKLSAMVTPGVWEFIAIEGMTDSNVVACRLTRE